jgi:hypothetical protein
MTMLETATGLSQVCQVQIRAIYGILALALIAGCSASPFCGYGFERVGDMCVPVCVEECGDHEYCNETNASAQCECVTGYAGEPCVWTGGLQNTDFRSDEFWTKTNGATVIPLATTPDGGGLASMASIVACSAGAVSQIVEMPSYDDAEPFAIKVTWQSENVLGVDVGYGRAFRRLQSRVPGWNTDLFCLGEAGYGGPVKFQIAATERLPNCFTAPDGVIEVDSFEIVVAHEDDCPPPGTLANGEANVDEGGWIFNIETTGSGTTTASLEPGVGESGSSGARIYKPAGGDKLAGMVTQLSVALPSEEVPSPALQFWWKGSKEWWYYVDLGTYPGTRSAIRPLDALFSGGTEQTVTYCLPPWTHGNVSDLSFVLQGGFFADEAELVVDNVEIINDPRCGDSTDLLDPSFDSAPNRWPGVAIRYEEEPKSSVNVINDPARAHPPGSGLLELRYGSNQARLEAQHYVWVPPSEENRGPQLVFHSNVPADPGLGVLWAFGTVTKPNLDCVGELCPPTPLSQELPKGGGWRRNAACLPAEWAERWYRVRVAIRPSEDPLEAFDPPREVLLDDFEVTTDESCPTQTQ